MPNNRIKNQEIARAFLNQTTIKKDILYCTDWDIFFKYEDGYYKIYESDKFEILVWRFICSKFPDIQINTWLIKDIIQQVKWGAYRKIKEIHTPWLAFKDRLYNIEKFEWHDFDREKIAIHQIEFNSQEVNMPIPKFKNFLETTLMNENSETDQQLIELTQEMFGHYLTNSLKGEMAFFLVGDGANGKSVMAKTIKAMIGEKYVSAISIEKLTMNQFSASSLVGKKINICSEEESKFLKSDRFKALVTNDMIQTERKFQNQFSFEPKTKYLFNSNRMPNFEGLNFGLRRRLTIIPFLKRIEGKDQNKNLSAELMNEMPGIVNWAIEGVKKLVKNNYIFTNTEATNETKKEFENSISSPVMFFREKYQKDKYGFVKNEDMYQEYKEWCIDGGKKPMSNTNFHRDISQNLNIKTRVRWDDGTFRGKAVTKKIEKMPANMKQINDLLEEDNKERLQW